MSYERDKDKYTRGVGAIAATDANNPRRFARRQARARALNQRDKYLAQYTYGQGGMGLAIDATGKVGAGTYGVVPPAPPTPPPGSTRPTTKLYGGSGTVLQQPSRTGTPAYQPPVLDTPPPHGVVIPTRTSSGGGGGSAIAPIATAPTTYPGIEPPASLDIPDDDHHTDVTPEVPYKKLAIAGGVLLGAWLLFGRKSA